MNFIFSGSAFRVNPFHGSSCLLCGLIAQGGIWFHSDDKLTSNNKLDEFIESIIVYPRMTTTLKERLLDHLEKLTGEIPRLDPVNASKLPLFLRERYDLFFAQFLGMKAVVAIESDDQESASPKQHAKFVEDLSTRLKHPVVLVLPKVTGATRDRLVQMNVHFIVPGRQIFLPGNMIDLREAFVRAARRGKTFSPAAQCTLLYHLLREPLEQTPLKEIAEKVGYTPMMLTKVKDEFETFKIARGVKKGRSMVLEFAAAGRDLWALAKPRLLSPVKRTRWVQWKTPAYPALLAGVSALSLKTMIADDPVPTYALAAGVLQDYLEKGILKECRFEEDATAKVEAWFYAPELIGDQRSVDPLSLYLSLHGSRDERVAQQLEKLIEKIQW